MHMHITDFERTIHPGQPAHTLHILRSCTSPVLSRRRLESATAVSGRACLNICWSILCVRKRAQRRIQTKRAAAPALTDFDVEVLTDVRDDQKTGKEEDEECQTSHSAWIVLIHAESRSCRMPFCKIPVLGKYVCSCAREGVIPPPEPGFGALKSMDGTCTRGPMEIATDIQAAVPVLSFETAFEISMRLLQSASSNSVGSATVIGGSKEKAEGFRQRLAFYGFWASVVPVEPG